MKHEKRKYFLLRSVATLLLAAFLLTFFPAGVSAEAGFPAPEKLNGADNIFLSYVFNTPYPMSGRRTKEGYLPLVGYYDTKGNLTDTFFDSFLFLPCVTDTPSGGVTYRNNQRPANFADWKAFVADVFRSGYNLPALNEAVAQVKKGLGSEYNNYKAKVFLSVMYPVKTQTNFGDVDGDGVIENFNNLTDRKKAVDWMIDYQLGLYADAAFAHLELVGFYWFEEDFVTNDVQELPLVQHMTSRVAGEGLKSIWIPYFNAPGYNRWEEFGFDVACYQPNSMFSETRPHNQVTIAVDRANTLGMAVEIESDSRVLREPEYYNRYMAYLHQATLKGANNGIKMYYNEAVDGVYYTAFKSGNPAIRAIYDLTYRYAKKTLDVGDIRYMDEQPFFQLHEMVSVGKSYTTTTPYTATEMGYGQVNGRELTDGVSGKETLGTDFIAFHKSLNEQGFYYVTLDLGAVRSDLSVLSLELGEAIGPGVSLPYAVEFLGSTDGKSYVNLATLPASAFNRDVMGAIRATVYLNQHTSLRYIRAKITPGSLPFVFVSEFWAGVKNTSLYASPGLTVVSEGKSYTTNKPYVATDALYGRITGNELTDGVLGSSILGNEWLAFHYNNAVDEKYNVVLDLGSEQNGLTRFALEMLDKIDYGISKPGQVSFSISSDGSNFTPIGNAIPHSVGNNIYAAVLDANPVAGRYVKAVFDKGAHSFVFASEMLVFQRTNLPLDVLPGKPLATNDGVCTVLQENLTVSLVKAMFNQPIRIENTAGKVVGDQERVATSYKVIAEDGQSLLICLPGDLDGSGAIDAKDYLMAKRGILGTYTLDNLQKSALDVSGDGLVNASDYLRIKRHVLKTFSIFTNLNR